MNTETKSTLEELKQVRAQVNGQVAGNGQEEEVVQDPPEQKEEEAPVAAKEGEEAPSAKKEEEEETLIQIGDQTFKTEAEAIAYANKLAHDKEINEAYNSGIQEAIAAAQAAAAPAKTQEKEDDFETKFYSNPKETLAEVQRKARDEAIAAIKQERSVEEQWRTFEEENPDLVGFRDIAKKVLADNWETIGKMTDIPKARKVLATKTRAIFQQWAEQAKPRTELPDKKGQVVSSGGGQGVTPAQTKKEEKPLDFISQIKANRKR